MKRFEKFQTAHLGMIATKFRSKLIITEDSARSLGDTEASDVRMYETHFPGFCYLRNGQYRRKISSVASVLPFEPSQCSEKVKAIIFSDDELDIQKVMCLHLLATHVRHKKHIQRKDGRVCSYVKSVVSGSRRHSLQPFTQRKLVSINEIPEVYEKTLPRYVLDIPLLDKESSIISVRSFDSDYKSSDEETKKRPRWQVPIYINNEIRVIVGSVIEALETVNSPKLNALINFANSPEELRNMLMQEDVQEFITELAGNPLVTKATSYDFVISHPMFDKIPDSGTMETVAQVLELSEDITLKFKLMHIRKSLGRRHSELVSLNIIPGNNKPHEKMEIENSSRLSFLSTESNSKCTSPAGINTVHHKSSGSFHMFAVAQWWKCLAEAKYFPPMSHLECSTSLFQILRAAVHSVVPADVQCTETPFRVKAKERKIERKERVSANILENAALVTKRDAKKIPNKRRRKVSVPLVDGRMRSLSGADESAIVNLKQAIEGEEAAIAEVETKATTLGSQQVRTDDDDASKYDLKNLSNPQRILLGLKVASLKKRPLNMHQFENKKKVDIPSIVTSIVKSAVADVNYNERSSEYHLNTYSSNSEKKIRHQMSCNLGSFPAEELENLTRGLLADLRQDISVAENKKRVNDFMMSNL